MRGFSLHCGLVRGTYQASHFILRFLRVITNAYFVRAKRSSARNFCKSPKKPDTSRWVEAFVATWRYLKYDLIADMGDILDRGQRMERTTTTTIEERVEMLPDQQMHHRTELNRRARTFLNDQLAGGPQLCRLIRQQAAKQGISLSMLLVAKRSLHVQSRTVNEQVIWQLPAAA
jgi:hypothetical protein